MARDELLDIFDADMNLLGSAARAQVHREGLWHQTFHCWIVRRDPTGCYLVFQRRGPDKDLFPNLLDVSAAGHLEAGETPVDGVREIAEELGLSVAFEQLLALGVRRSEGQFGGMIDREFCHTFLLALDTPLGDYQPKLDEVDALVQMEVGVAAQLLLGQAATAPATGLAWDTAGIARDLVLDVVVDAIAPRPPDYYPTLLEQVATFLKGT